MCERERERKCAQSRLTCAVFPLHHALFAREVRRQLHGIVEEGVVLALGHRVPDSPAVRPSQHVLVQTVLRDRLLRVINGTHAHLEPAL